MWNWCRAALIATVFIPSSAFAQTQSLAGAWTFRAVFEEIGCSISGEATLTATRADNVYDVAMTATETCRTGSYQPVGQQCIARRTQDRVAIRCIIVSIEPGRPYLPDDFELTVQDANLMTGLLTANWNAPAVWRRLGRPPVA
jgi:hypothetical protein